MGIKTPPSDNPKVCIGFEPMSPASEAGVLVLYTKRLMRNKGLEPFHIVW